MLLLLHLDEFVPFGKAGPLNNTKENFYKCWKQMLLPIQKTPEMFLYISGRLPYFDTIGSGELGGQSPCGVLSVQLDLFSPEIIHDVLRKISVPSLPKATALPSGTKAPSAIATIPLSEALGAIFATGPGAEPGPGLAREVARRLHELTGGVPRFVEHALHALLTEPMIHAALFRGEHSSSDLEKLLDLDSFFMKGSLPYGVVTMQASIHFAHAMNAINLMRDGEKARDEHVAGLLVLVLLQGKACPVSTDEIKLLQSGAQFSWDTGQVPFLLREAQYWGFHRDVDLTGETVKFPIPAP
jgi:hypothetical protein